VLVLIVCAVALALMAGAHVLLARKSDVLLRGVTERTEARDRALQKQAKEHFRRAAQTDRAAAKTLDKATAALDAADHVREDARAVNSSIQAVLQDRRVQRLLDHQGGE
jgi:hypothetical protein